MVRVTLAVPTVGGGPIRQEREYTMQTESEILLKGSIEERREERKRERENRRHRRGRETENCLFRRTVASQREK